MYKGILVTGYRHKDCINTIAALIGKPVYILEGEDKGFLTTHKRFVNRREAYLIAKANNQLLLSPKEDDSNEFLTSEEIYFNPNE